MSGLLGLVGIDADPLSSREHILLVEPHPATRGRRAERSTCRRWSAMVGNPPIRKLGVFELDSSSRPTTAWRWR